MLPPLALFVHSYLLVAVTPPPVQQPALGRQHVVMCATERRAPIVEKDALAAAKTALKQMRRPLNIFLRGRAQAEYVCGKNKYGCDPRDNPSNMITDPQDTLARQLLPLAKPGVVNELVGGAEQLDALLEDAGDERVLVLKFKREGCPACNSTVAPLQSAAKAYVGRADFFTVDYSRLKAFCRKCAIKVVPCAHIYVGGQLVDTLPLGPSAWADFAARLQGIAGEPTGAVLAAEIPPTKSAADARRGIGIDAFL